MAHLLTTLPFAVALFVAFPAFAETTSKPGKHDPRITYATFLQGQVYTVYTQVRAVTLIEVGEGERIQSIAIGDLQSFNIDRLEAQNLFIIKPTVTGVSTNLTVETNRNIYFLNLISTTERRPMYSVKFTVPGSARRGQTSSGRPATPDVSKSYAVLKKPKMPKFAPVSVMDDGYRTSFRIPADAPMPTIYRADDGGAEYSVNSSVSGTTLTVTTRSDRWVLRIGDEYVCIEARK